MRIDIVCAECGQDLTVSFNTAKDELEISLCDQCLIRQTDEAYDQGYREGTKEG